MVSKRVLKNGDQGVLRGPLFGCGKSATYLYSSALVPGSPLTVKLRCSSWRQLSAIHARDLSRGAFFLKTAKPPALGTRMRINLSLPSGSVIKLEGIIKSHLGAGELDGRGPGIDIELDAIPQSVLWLIESALTSAGLAPVSQRATPSNSTEVDDSGMEDGGAVVAAEAELIRALWQEIQSMSKLNPFQMLQVPQDSDDQQVRSAFGALTKKYHPDRYARYESFEVRELASEVFILLRDAYRRISAESGRQKERSLLAPAKRISAEKTLVDSQPVFHESANAAETLTDMPPEPRDLTKPIRMTPSHAGHAATGMQLIEAGEYQQAREILSTASRKDRNDLRARAGYELVEGLLALNKGDRMEAGQRFEAALDFDPSNERAAREIAEMRRFSTHQRRGVLSKLMQGD